jgi:hypothetical protein
LIVTDFGFGPEALVAMEETAGESKPCQSAYTRMRRCFAASLICAEGLICTMAALRGGFTAAGFGGACELRILQFAPQRISRGD